MKNKKIDSSSSDFIFSVSHQIKSPLAAIKGFATLLIDGHYGKIPKKALKTLEKIKASSERALDLTANLLDLKRIETGQMHYNFKHHDLGHIVENVVHELRFFAEDKKIDLIFEKPERAIILNVDDTALHQVFQNLVDNAIKYTHKGWVKVSIEEEDKKVLIKVSDSGLGMPKEILPTIFGKYKRDQDAKRHAKGIGLGLFIAKTIVEAHKGRIWAESAGPGKGSAFLVELPL